MRARDPTSLACQLGGRVVGRQGPDEVPGAAAQGLGLLQHPAEEALSSSGDAALRRARGPVRGPQEHQPHCAEKVRVTLIRQVFVLNLNTQV